MAGTIIATPHLSTKATNGRPNSSAQFWPDAGVGMPKPPLLPAGAPAHVSDYHRLKTRVR